MYTTTQLLLLLFALSGTGGPAQSYAQNRNELAPTAAVTIPATDNGTPIRTQLNVWRIMRRNEDLIKQDLGDLEHGMPFETVAAKQFPNLPVSVNAPWDLGYLRWKQVPAEWASAISGLKKGQHSGIIRGPNNRFWIIRLNDRREDMTVSYVNAKSMIVEMMRSDRARQSREKTLQELRDKARIVYSKQVGSQTAISRLDQ